MATFEQVKAAVEAIEQRGASVSVRAVRVELGGGSHTTIMKFLSMLRGASQAAQRSIPITAAPGELQERLVEICGEMWCAAQQLAAAQVDAERAALEQTRQRTEADMDRLGRVADDYAAEFEQLGEKCKDLEAANVTLKVANTELDGQVKMLRELIAAHLPKVRA